MKAPCGQSAPYAETLKLSRTARPHPWTAQSDGPPQRTQNGQCFVVPMHEVVVRIRDPPLSRAPRLPTISAVQHFASQTASQLGV